MVIDQKRIKENRNAVFPCITNNKIEKFKGSKRDKSRCFKFKNINQRLMKGYSKLLEYVTYRIFIILITLVLFGMGLYGALQIQNKSDEIKHLPADSYLREWFETLKEDYPDLGYNVKLFTGPMDQDIELKKLDLLMRELVMLQERGQIINEMDSWWLAFNNSFLQEKRQTDLGKDDDSRYNFTTLLSEFLHSSIGAKYKSNFVFNGELECNKPAPFVNATSIDIVYQKFSGPEEYIPSIIHPF